MLNIIDKITDINFFKEGQNEDLFIGRPYAMSYHSANILISDYWKHKVKGIPQGAFLLAFYDNPHEEEVEECLLLRVLNPTPLPTDNNIISSMIEYYKDNLNTSGKKSDLDNLTKYEFSFSGLECRVLGSFYTNNNKLEFGADVENYYSAHNYKVFKATNKILELIVNQRDKGTAGGENEFALGKVRYSSSKRFYSSDKSIHDVQVFINPNDLLGKRTALFGMTRTGKSNSVKKIIQATTEISNKVKLSEKSNPESFNKHTGVPTLKVGQVIFDINGEYANANLQDKGTAIFDLYKDSVIRYSVLDKTGQGFRVLKTNFYTEIQAGFELVKSSLNQDSSNSNYIKSVCAIDLSIPDNYYINVKDKTSDERNAANLYDRKIALYKACLHAAGFKINNHQVKFFGDVGTINEVAPHIIPHNGISLDQCIEWFSLMYEAIVTKPELFNKYKTDKGFDYFDEDMKALLVFLTRKLSPNANATIDGFRKLRSIINLHTPTIQESFETEIVKSLRDGKIIIIDLSQGDPLIQELYSQKICTRIFNDAMLKFIKNQSNNFIQFYFEEAHNLFPKKDNSNLSQIYNRIDKEGAKLNLGMVYATQEVSSISSNILKNTQNWFISHLNNEDETKELRKYYDFADFTESLIRFSAKNDKGFARMKIYSNPFVVPVQIDQFLAENE